MKLVNKISLLFVFLLLFSLCASALSIWSFRAASEHVRKVSLAYQVHSHLLSLKSHTYQLFKQYGDATMIGDLDNGAGEAALIAEIRRDIRAARTAITQELELQGEQELEELEGLASIELMIEQLIRDLDRVLKQQAPDAPMINWRELSRILEADIDRDFHAMISAALAEEKREVEESLAEATAEADFYSKIALGFAGLSILFTLGSVLVIVRYVGRPVTSLLSGLRAFSEGNQSRRIQVLGTGEIAEVVETFNMMADRISERTASLTSENRALESAVAERTGQLEEVVSELKKADGNRKRMLADVSHELRTPLTIIQGEADIALRGADKSPGAYRDALTRARDAARHTARLVDDLLFIARSESDEVRLNVGQLDLTALIEETITTYGNDVTFLSDEPAAPMRGDADRIRQAVLTLLENARHHGGDVVVSRLTRTPDGFCFAVEDNGPGMSEQDKAQAFDRFFRGSNAAERYREGLGLGLPVARSIAVAHGGRVELSDRPGGGLIASLMLPKRPSLKAVA